MMTCFIYRELSTGITPFMEAASEGHEIIVQLFLQHVSSFHNWTCVHALGSNKVASEKNFFPTFIDVHNE